VSARDIRYKRQGGRWGSPDAGLQRQTVPDALAQGGDDRRPVDLDAGTLFHPETIARHRAHDRRDPGTCAKETAGSTAERRRVACSCQPDPVDLEAIWAGRARMAAARRTAGRPLDAVDRQALARIPASAAISAAIDGERAAEPVATDDPMTADLSRLFDLPAVPEGVAAR